MQSFYKTRVISPSSASIQSYFPAVKLFFFSIFLVVKMYKCFSCHRQDSKRPSHCFAAALQEQNEPFLSSMAKKKAPHKIEWNQFYTCRVQLFFSVSALKEETKEMPPASLERQKTSSSRQRQEDTLTMNHPTLTSSTTSWELEMPPNHQASKWVSCWRWKWDASQYTEEIITLMDAKQLHSGRALHCGGLLPQCHRVHYD